MRGSTVHIILHQPHSQTWLRSIIYTQVKRLVEPLRDFLSLFFFASLGEFNTRRETLNASHLS